MVPKCGGLIDCVFSPSVASPGKALSWSSWATDQSVRDLATRGMTERFPSFAMQRSQEAPFGVEQAVAMRAAGGRLCAHALKGDTLATRSGRPDRRPRPRVDPPTGSWAQRGCAGCPGVRGWTGPAPGTEARPVVAAAENASVARPAAAAREPAPIGLAGPAVVLPVDVAKLRFPVP